MTTSFPRGNLPPLTVLPTDAAEIEARMVSHVEGDLNTTLSPGDPRRLLVVSIASYLTIVRNEIDFAAKQNYLTYARDDFIDHLGDRDDIGRLAATPALTTIRFSLSEARGAAYVIPVNTLLDAGGIVFSTVEQAVIPAGEIFVDVVAQCLEAGAVGNGFLPGQIKTMINPLPYIESAINLTASSGGTDRESDDAYVERIRLSRRAFSVAGPEEAYRFYALTAHPSIVDVYVGSPSPAEIDIRVLLDGGEAPSPEIINLVLDAVNGKNRRPLSDRVSVSAPTESNYDIYFEYYISASNAPNAVAIQDRVAAAVNEYKHWQSAKIGRDINPDELRRFVLNAGAKRLVIGDPIFTVVGDEGVAKIGSSLAEFAGIEND